MTKTLTEQWREGTLPIGKYYIKTKWWGCDGKWHYEKEEDIDYLDGDWRFYQDDAVEKVLAPVPRYDVWKQMIDGDKATIHHLKKILPMIEYNKVAYDYLKQVIEDMEKDIKEVK